MGEEDAIEVYRAAEKRWLAEPSGSYPGIVGVLIGTIRTEGHPELLIKAAEHMDRIGSVDRIVEEYLDVRDGSQ